MLFFIHNRDITDYGLPKPEKITTELEMENLRYDPDHQAALLEEMNVNTPNNPEQQQVFDIVKDAIDTSTPTSPGQFIFINGPAGSGKTTLSQKSNALLNYYNFSFLFLFHYCTASLTVLVLALNLYM